MASFNVFSIKIRWEVVCFGKRQALKSEFKRSTYKRNAKMNVWWLNTLLPQSLRIIVYVREFNIKPSQHPPGRYTQSGSWHAKTTKVSIWAIGEIFNAPIIVCRWLGAFSAQTAFTDNDTKKQQCIPREHPNQTHRADHQYCNHINDDDYGKQFFQIHKAQARTLHRVIIDVNSTRFSVDHKNQTKWIQIFRAKRL